MYETGQLIGCEATFPLIRTSSSHDNQQPLALSGAIAVMHWPGKAALVGMKLVAASATQDEITPGAVGLTVENGTNVDDHISSANAMPGTVEEAYRMGDATVSALAAFGANDILTAYYTLPGETLGSDFYADFRVKHYDPAQPDGALRTSGAGAAFAGCVEKLLQQP